MTRVTEAIRCPYCDSTDTEFMSLFGQQLLTVQYYCNACRTPFERVKGDDVLADATSFQSALGETRQGSGES